MFDALQDPAVPTSQFLAEFRERMNKLAACPNLSLTTYIPKDLASAAGAAAVRVPRVPGHPLNFDNGCQAPVLREKPQVPIVPNSKLLLISSAT